MPSLIPLKPLPDNFWEPIQAAQTPEQEREAVEERQQLLRRIFWMNLSRYLAIMRTLKQEMPASLLTFMTPTEKAGIWTGATEGISKELFEKHFAARLLGLALAAGHYIEGDEKDVQIIRRMVERESQFWAGLAKDAVAPTGRARPRYETETGAVNAEAVRRRFDLYVNRLDGSLVQGWQDRQPRGTELAWVMSIVEHCATCIERAGLGYQPVSFWRGRGWFPRDGSTLCGTRCRCHFVTKGGEVGGVETKAN